MTSQYFMDLLSFLILPLIGYSSSLAANDDRRCNGTLPNADLDSLCDRRPGSTCTYQCHTPYHSIYSPPEIVCQGTNLMWSHEQLCSVVRCAGSFHGGRMSVPCDMYEGSTCAVQCDDRYKAAIESLQVTCLSSGRWNYNLTNVCQESTVCPPVYYDGSIDSTCDMLNGSMCIYKCNQGFTMNVDVMVVTCLDNGTWSTDLTGICVKDTRCPEYVPNGWLSSTCTRQEGDTCSISCNQGYTLSFPETSATCLSSQRWDIDLSYFCVSEDYLCPANFPNGWISSACIRQEGYTCSIFCNIGYTLSLPGMTATCLSFRSWDVDLSNVCRFESSLCPDFVPNGMVSSNCTSRVGETCSISCNLGYTLSLPGMTATCLSSLRWDVDLLNICVSENSLCPEFVPNGWISSTCTRQEGDTCSISCNQGYTLSFPEMPATCLSSLRWDIDLSNICVPEDPLCSAYVPNGLISAACARREGDTCSINCNYGYTLRLPGMNATCLSFGSWDVDLSNVCRFENPLCSAYVPNGWLSTTCNRREGDTCSINCNYGYALKLPGMKATCSSSGSWDVDLSNVCRFENGYSGSIEYKSPSSKNIINSVMLAVGVVIIGY